MLVPLSNQKKPGFAVIQQKGPSTILVLLVTLGIVSAQVNTILFIVGQLPNAVVVTYIIRLPNKIEFKNIIPILWE
jgi:hypothetical protein